MEIIVRKGGRVPGTRKMSVQERESIAEQAKERDSELRASGANGASPGGLYTIAPQADRETIRREAERMNVKIQADDELTARGKQKDRMESERRELKDKLKGLIPPRHLQNARPGSSEYAKAVRAGERALGQDVTKMFERYQDLSRSLDPHNPAAGLVSEIIE